MSENQSPKAQNRKVNVGGVIGIVVMLLIGFAVGFFGAEAIDNMGGGDGGKFFINLGIALVGLYLAFFLQIVLHEAGHLVFGLLTGYNFVSFNVFGFIWQKGPDGKLRMGRMQIAGAGGQCLMAPPEYNDGEFPFALYNLGGVLMNLLTGAAFALLAAVIPVTWLKILLLMQTMVGVAFALTNGLPLRTEAIQNDGKNLLCIRKDEVARRAFWVQMSVAAEQARGRRIKSMPEEWFAPAPEDKMDNVIVSAVAVINTTRLMDKLDFDAAEKEIRALLAREKGVLGLYRTSIACDGAVCELIAGRPADLTESLSTKANQQIMKAMKRHPSILRTQYAIALLKERDVQKADKLLAAFEAAAKKHPNPQEIVAERELIFAIQAASLKQGVAAN